MERYFALNYRGFPMEDLSLTDADGLAVALCRCRVCGALTDTPAAHGDWHESEEA